MMDESGYLVWLQDALRGGADGVQLTSERLADHVIRFNREIGEIIVGHGVQTVGEAVWYVYGLNSGYIGSAIRDNTIETALRVLDSVKDLYAHGFNEYCEEHGPEHIHTILDTACEMLWDMDAIEYAVRTHEDLLHRAFEVLEYALFLPNPMCQGSAIHGLGHLAFTHPQPPGQILDRYIASNLPSASLRRYAEQAKTGIIL
ncbi:MAG: hypothetical protein R3330_12070 [Saprospiraceae bacterium]|nr:hypothetical protein [Saprospiraceae bacterium]